MHFTRTLSLGLGLASLFALGAARPAAAQDLLYTLNGVAFNDGGEAFGSFEYNPTTHHLISFNLGTTAGMTANGFAYNAEDAQPFLITNNTFEFLANDASHLLGLATTSSITSPGVYSLFPGTIVTPHEISGSGELTPTGARVVLGKPAGKAVGAFSAADALSDGPSSDGPSFVVTFAPAAVPEASTTISLGLLLALGLGGVTVSARRRETTVKTDTAA